MLTDILYRLKCLILSILDIFLQIKFSLKISLTAKFVRHNNSYLSVVIYSHMQHLYHYEFRIVNGAISKLQFCRVKKRVKTQKPYHIWVVLQNAD